MATTIETLNAILGNPAALKTMTDAELETLRDAAWNAHNAKFEEIKVAHPPVAETYSSGNTFMNHTNTNRAMSEWVKSDAPEAVTYRAFQAAGEAVRTLVNKEIRRRNTNATRAANAAQNAAGLASAATYTVGQVVKARGHGSVRNAKVIEISARGVLTIQYLTKGGALYTKQINPSKVIAG